ncbi:hypothetical protein J2R98_000511 [Alkalibacillus filiformis]|uniref:Uncharacterized protein n=1 Tax=Alkalibacillus filiformis TaxID=200990 RepID=A0ABU0DQI9_9BACI|nr:hypothetical protein [Alkalibacillus filiformis]MDQ0350708.1 hypothetical protein [Alkalibacillus filiformis]
MKSHFIKASPFVISFVVIYFFMDITIIPSEKFTDLLVASIAYSSSSIGFFIAGVSILQTSQISRFYKKLVELGTNKKLISWLMAAIGYMFILSSLSLLLLYLISNGSTITYIIYVLWLSVFLSSIFTTLIIILLFYTIFSQK